MCNSNLNILLFITNLYKASPRNTEKKKTYAEKNKLAMGPVLSEEGCGVDQFQQQQQKTDLIYLFLSSG